MIRPKTSDECATELSRCHCVSERVITYLINFHSLFSIYDTKYSVAHLSLSSTTEVCIVQFTYSLHT
ncbi:hypothetical protein M405DRAFT_98148 [Rhizopogon salebrosus TDB-379]|nr:hypothetical protein M405DRAFT_98148 [Rhizopogon salebrosus TDB-379]